MAPRPHEISKTLLKTSRYAIWSCQLAGYLPLSITPKASPPLFFSWISLPTISSLLGLFVMTGWTLTYYVHFKSKLYFMRVFGSTEAFAYLLIIIAGTSSGVYLRFLAFRLREKDSHLFQQNFKLFEKFESFGFKVSEWSEIAKVQSYLKWSFYSYFIPLVVLCTMAHIVEPLLLHQKFGRWLPDIVYTMGSGAWLFWSYLLIGNLWIVFFPRVYCACYREIIKDIKAKFATGRRRRASSIVWYPGEIFGKMEKLKAKETIKIKNVEFFQNFYEDGLYKYDLDVSVNQYIELVESLGEMISQFNTTFGERLLWEMITCISTIILSAFFGCFWLNRGQLRVIGQNLGSMYFYGKKVVELGYSCGNISDEARSVVRTLIQHVPLDELSEGSRRKVGHTYLHKLLHTKTWLMTSGQLPEVERRILM